uniref:Uncharacterized protein At5g50100, chloroplastic isoform X3 n=1 Tax=Elaeis guineensis var. tenera TaxID=51953 RepID=A0A6I9RUG1_ELAGV|nr:uncharacterized protein At5g50100, chloroplastic isoform X3 [Elaeis guineensis]
MACRAILPRLSLRPPISASSASTSPFTILSCRPSHSLRAFRCHVHSEAKLETVTQPEEDTCTSMPWRIKMLYDGDCPLCMREVMGRIHAILSDGTVVRDVEAFRKLYEEVGLGWVYAITKYEPVATIANAVYSVWAKYRLQITGRPPLEDILESRLKKRAEACSGDKVCKM